MRPENRTHGYLDRDPGAAELKLLANPKRPKHEDMVEWWGDIFPIPKPAMRRIERRGSRTLPLYQLATHINGRAAEGRVGEATEQIVRNLNTNFVAGRPNR